MADAKHTPGPWHIARFEASTVEIRNERGLTIAEVGDSSIEDAANARLIAAAPELLDALILMVRTHDEPAESLLQEAKEQKWIAQARSAIAKATGQAS